jgi:hypothetical protein
MAERRIGAHEHVVHLFTRAAGCDGLQAARQQARLVELGWQG